MSLIIRPHYIDSTLPPVLHCFANEPTFTTSELRHFYADEIEIGNPPRLAKLFSIVNDYYISAPIIL